MAAIKSYKDFSQTKKLAEILPLESADMYYSKHDTIYADTLYDSCDIQFFYFRGYTPCWSLAALLSVLPPYQLQTQDDGIGILCSCNGKLIIVTADNPVDACYDMILKLRELKIL